MTRYRFRLENESECTIPPPLEVTVVSSTVEGTLAGLRTAGKLWRSQDAQIKVLMPMVVQFPAPLSDPPVSPDVLARQLCALDGSDRAESVQVNVLLCRDAIQALREALKPCSVVVVGGCKRGWLAREAPLVRALRKAGHSIVVADGR